MDKKLQYIYEMYPNAKCELNYKTIFQLLIAVALSAQTTDKRVNECTPTLFEKYKEIKDLAYANINDVKEIIRPIGMTNTKATHIISIAKIIHEKYNDVVPCDPNELINLPGVGNKTINVIRNTNTNDSVTILSLLSFLSIILTYNTIKSTVLSDFIDKFI